MNKKLAAALAAAAATLLVVTGCGDDTDAQTKEWAGQVCDRIQPELRKVQEANEAISKASEEKDPEKVQEVDAEAFGQISNAYAAMSRAVKSAGAPPVDDGENTHADAVRELDATADAYADLKKTVEGLDAKDQAKFADGLQTVAGELETLTKSGDKALNELQAGELGQALSEQAGCQKPAAEASQAA